MLRIGVALLLAAASAQGQLSPTIDKIDVAVTEVDVVVLDSAGKPVPGLTRDVFDLKVNGRARPISNFYEVNRRVDAPSSLPSHRTEDSIGRRDYLLIFVDELHLHQGGKRQALDGLRAFIQREVRPGTAAMLVDFDDSLMIRQRFTEDPSVLMGAIDGMNNMPARTSNYEAARRELLMTLDQVRDGWLQTRHWSLQLPMLIDRVAVAAQVDVERTIAAVGSAAGMIGGLDGRRVLVFVSDGVPMQPGVEISEAFQPELYTPPAEADAAAYKALTDFKSLDTMKHNLQVPVQQLATETAAAGVQFFAIDTRGARTEERLRQSSATQTRLNENLIRTNLHSPVQLLAEETGGAAILDETDLGAAFGRLSEQLRSYYSLGFRSDESSEKADSISVRVKGRGLTVRATRHVRLRSVREQIAERVRAHLYAPAEDNPLNASVDASPLSGSEPGLKVTVRVPWTDLSVVPGERKSFAVTVALIDHNDVETPPRMFLAKTGLEEAAESVHTVALRVPTGTYTVSIAITDAYSSQTSFLQRQVTVP